MAFLGLGRSALITALLSVVIGYYWIRSNKNTTEGLDQKLSGHDIVYLLLTTIAVTLTACYAWLRINYPIWWSDLLYFRKLIQWGMSIKKKMKSGETILDVFDRHVYQQPDHPCILFEDEVYTYAEVDGYANRVARWVMDTDTSLRKGDAICLLLHNGPVFAGTCMGLMKLGIVASLLNTNLKPAALLHCLEVSEARKIIFGVELWALVKEMLPQLSDLNIEAWMIIDTEMETPCSVSSVVLTMDLSKLSGHPYARDAHKLTDMAIYIFTSGTTGMPKPVNVLHRKIIRATYLHFFSYLTPDDVYYIALPMYHSAALLQGVFSIWYYGGTAAIANKFSASRFWDDIRKHRATGFHYIGELCRYLLAQPKKPEDGLYPHEIRICQGNGLRPEIWREFQERFKIGNIFEIYAATEGNFGLINIDGKVGTVGRYPWFMKNAVDTLEIVDYDYASGEPKRGSDGFCIQLRQGETGLALTKINKSNPYTGYKGSEEKTLQKIVSNVKKSGDMYFNSGDLLMLDEDGYVYFKDRLGDTFRWKGENVSTMEVSQTLSTFPSILEANVYGVKIPGQDGRAGMAAVVIREGYELDLKELFGHVTNYLPGYACPKFIRIMDSMEITGTFKHKKTKLVEQGFDIDVTEDPIYVIDVRHKTYGMLTAEHMRKIQEGLIQF
nr:long-chain fatty acid transport protein 2-like [Lytechinus pictus]